MIKVSIPATSANLGAGFDTLGIAVGLFNEIEVTESDRLVIESADDIPVPQDETNLVHLMMSNLYTLCGRTLPPVHIRQTNRIPIARGLGSSSACIIGGLCAANRMLGEPFDEAEMLRIACRFEGHPDNVAPALLGGFVCAVIDGKEVHYVRQDLPDDLKFAALIPDFELETTLARSVLPREYPRRDAVHNVGRAALMAVSMTTHRYDNLAAAVDDRIHQPYRLHLIAGAHRALDVLRQSGAYCAYISGAGSTLMAMVPAADDGYLARTRAALDEAGFAKWQLLLLDGNNSGAVCTGQFC